MASFVGGENLAAVVNLDFTGTGGIGAIDTVPAGQYWRVYVTGVQMSAATGNIQVRSFPTATEISNSIFGTDGPSTLEQFGQAFPGGVMIGPSDELYQNGYQNGRTVSFTILKYTIPA